MRNLRLFIAVAGIVTAMALPIVVVGFADNESVEFRLFWSSVVEGWWNYKCTVVSFGDSASLMIDRINRVTGPVCDTGGMVSFDTDFVASAMIIDSTAVTIVVLMAASVVVSQWGGSGGSDVVVGVDLISVILSILLLGYCFSLADKTGHAGTDSIQSSVSFGAWGFVAATLALNVLNTTRVNGSGF